MTLWITQFQYQAKAEVVSTSPEQVTESRWHQPWSEPVRPRVSTTMAVVMMCGGVFAPVLTTAQFPEQVTESRWHQGWSEPVRVKPGLLAAQQQFLAFHPQPIEAVTESRWHQPWSEPVRFKPGLAAQAQQTLALHPQPVVPFGWFAPLAELAPKAKAALPIPQQQFYAAPALVVTAEVITADKWYVAFADPVRVKPALPAAQQQAPAYTGADPFPEAVTEDRWHQPWSEPVRVKPGVAASAQQALALAPNPVVPFGWNAALSTPSVLAKAGLAPAAQQALALTQAAPFAESVTEDRWHQAWSEPVRLKPRMPEPQQQALFFVAPSGEIVTVDKWFAALSEPSVKARAGLGGALQQFLAYSESQQFPETASYDRFGYAWSEPVRAKRALGAAQQAAFVANLAEIITPDKWFAALSEPVRLKIGLAAAQQQALALTQTPVAETITEDKWHQAWSEPVRQKPGLGAAQQQALALTKADPFPESVSEDRWHQPWSEPVRFKPGLAAQAQQVLAFDPRPFVSFGWIEPLSEPVRVKLRLPEGQQLAFTLPAQTVSIAWWQPLAEPVRAKLGLAASAQQFLALTQAAPFAEAVSEDRWHQPWSEPPVKVKLGVAAAAQQALAFLPPSENITIDKWFAAFSEPVRSKAALAAARQAAAFLVEAAPFPETVTEDRWHQPWSEPIVKARPRLREAAQPFTAFNPQPFVSFGYFRGFTDPVRVKPRLLDAAQAFEFFIGKPETVTADKWLYRFSEPVRVKLGLAASAQQFLALAPNLSALTPSIIGILAALETKDMFLAGGMSFNAPRGGEIGVVEQSTAPGEIGLIERPSPGTAAISGGSLSVRAV